MRGPREVELKYFLPDEAAADALCAALDGDADDPVDQVNHLFDTPEGSLRANGLSLRLREEEGVWEVTLKGPSRRRGGARDREEREAEVSPNRAHAMLAGSASPLSALVAEDRADLVDDHADLIARAREIAQGRERSLGSFRNRRLRVRAPLPGYGPVTFEIDRTELPGGRVDREVEVELDIAGEVATAEKALRELLESLGIDPRPASGKSGRFVKAAGLFSG